MLADKDMNNLPSVVVAGCRTREYERRPLSFHIKPSLDLVSRGVYLAAAAAAVWSLVTLLLAADGSSSCDCDPDSDPVASQLSSSEQRDDDHVPRPSETVAATSCCSRSQSVGGSSLTAS